MLDPSKLKEFADDNSKFDKNGIKLPRRIDNRFTSNFSFPTVFILFYFSKDWYCKHRACLGKGQRVKPIIKTYLRLFKSYFFFFVLLLQKKKKKKRKEKKKIPLI